MPGLPRLSGARRVRDTGSWRMRSTSDTDYIDKLGSQVPERNFQSGYKQKAIRKFKKKGMIAAMRLLISEQPAGSQGGDQTSVRHRLSPGLLSKALIDFVTYGRFPALVPIGQPPGAAPAHLRAFLLRCRATLRSSPAGRQ